MGCLPGLILLLVLGPLLVSVIDLAFAPWIYRVGGRTRLLPVWSGIGFAETPHGRYQVGLSFSPSPSGSRILPGANILGSGYVCTPSGHRYSLKFIGGASGRIWNDMDGHSFRLSAYHRPFFADFGGDRRPRLEFSGAWAGPNLQMNDEGSLSQAFLADGSLNAKPGGGSHVKDGAVPITFTETSWWGRGNCRSP
jgi:hypothetical protein